MDERTCRRPVGFVRDGQLPFYASMLMNSEVCRKDWAHFGDLRVQEAEGDRRAERFTEALNKAAQAHPQEQSAAA
ncbi:hypothetical protein ACFVHS_07360 [Streptomyces sp. NPDC057746]|uniref:hypothetical protein n=1 Tax=Streptomyces sp. NPDC057746 TaxID=3346237 RepID=UPI0036842442